MTESSRSAPPLAARFDFASPDFVVGLLFAIASAFLLWMSYLPDEQSLSDSLGTMYWPRLVLWGVLGCSMLLIAVQISARKLEARTDSDCTRGSQWPLIAVTCCAAYLALVAIAGFLLSTLAFCVAFPVLLGIRDWWRVAVFSGIVTVTIWLLVIVAMHVILPRGIGAFRDFSLFLY